MQGSGRVGAIEHFGLAGGGRCVVHDHPPAFRAFLVEIGGVTYDFQIYGDDDSKAKKCRDGILNTRLSIQLYEMYWNNGKLWHSSHILCNLDKTAKITYLRIDTNKGRKFANLL